MPLYGRNSCNFWGCSRNTCPHWTHVLVEVTPTQKITIAHVYVLFLSLSLSLSLSKWRAIRTEILMRSQSELLWGMTFANCWLTIGLPLMATRVKNPPAVHEKWGFDSWVGSQRVGFDWASKRTHTYTHKQAHYVSGQWYSLCSV